MKSVKEKLCKKFFVAISMQSRDWNVLAILIISSITYLVTYARKKKRQVKYLNVKKLDREIVSCDLS